MKYYVSIETSPWNWESVIAKNRKQALRVCVSLKKQGINCSVLWKAESANELLRELKIGGAYWAKRVWHFASIPESKLKHIAIEKHARITTRFTPGG